MQPNAEGRLHQLEQTVADLQRRMGQVEHKLGTTPAPRPTRVPVDPVSVPAATPAPLTDTAKPADAEQPTSPSSLTTSKTPDVSFRETWAAFEKWFGKYGMATGGALLVTIALVWGATLVYQYIGPEVKLAALALVSGSLIFFGDRKSRDEKLAWWGQALIGTGYAIAQFMLYASHHVSSLQVVDNPIVSSFAMLALALIGGAHAIWRRSEPTALLSVILAFVTLSLSPVSYFSVAASAIILSGLVLCTVRMRWHTVYAVGMAASYAVFLVFTQGQVMAAAATPLAGLLLSAAFLAVYWLAFNLVGFLLAGDETGRARRGTILGVTVANAAAFIGPTLFQMGSVFPEWRWAFLAAVGVAYLLAVPLYRLRDGLLSQVILVLGLQFITACIPLKLDHEAVAAVWLLEAAALTALGMRGGLPLLRIFALALSVVCLAHLAFIDLPSERAFDLIGWVVPSRSLIALTAALAFGVCYALYQWARFERYKWESVLGNYYLRVALALTALVAFLDVPTHALPIVFAVEAAALCVLGFLPPRKTFANAGLLFFAGAVATALLFHSTVSLAVVHVLGVLGLAIGLAYRYHLLGSSASDAQQETHTRSEMFFVASAVLAYGYSLCTHWTDPALPSLPWAIQAVSLAVAGLVLRSRVLRYLGAAGMAAALFGIGHAYVNEVTWTWLTNGTVVGLLAALALAYRFITVSESRPGMLAEQLPGEADETSVAKEAYALTAAVLLASTGGVLLAGSHLTLCWLLEGIALLTIGFGFREKSIRSAGLLLFVVLLGKLLWWDLSGVSDFLRVLIYLGAGVVTLGGSRAYFKYTRDE